MTTVFIQYDNILTETGQQVIDYIEARITEAKQSGDVAAALNKLGQPYGFYNANVLQAKTLAPWEFARDHRAGMEHAHSHLQFQESQQQQQEQVEENKETGTKLTEQLEALRRELATVKGQNTKLTNRVKALESDEAEAQVEDGKVDDEVKADTEDEAADETTDDEEAGDDEV